MFNGFVGYSLMIAVFTPLFISGHGELAPEAWSLGRRSMVLGIVLSLYPLGQFVGAPILGALSGRFGRKMPLVASILGYLLIAYAIQSERLWLLVLSLLFTGVLEANIAIAQSAIADVASDANRGRLFGYIYGFVSSAYVIGPLVGGKLADPAILPWFGPSTPFWAAAILVGVSFLLVLFGFRETHTMARRTPARITASFLNLLDVFRDRDVRGVYLANFILYLTIFGFFRCFPMYIVDEFKLDISTESEFIAWVAVPIILMNFLVNGAIFRRWSFRTAAVASAVLMGSLMVVVVVPSPQWALWITLFVVIVPLALCMAAIASLISSRVGGPRQGRVMGNNQAVQAPAEGISGLVGGLLAAPVIWLPLVAFGGIAILGALTLWLATRERGNPARF